MRTSSRAWPTPCATTAPASASPIGTSWTPIEEVSHPLLRDTLAILQALAKQASSTTPFVLLSQAVEELQVRPLLRRRQDRTAKPALANIDQFLESARPYDVRGLRAFTTAMKAQWTEAQRAIEGRPDTEQQSVSLVTMHSSKGPGVAGRDPDQHRG